MRTMTDGVDRSLEDDSWRRPFNDDDGDGSLRRRGGIGSAHHAHNVGALTVPSCCGGNPLLAAIDDPVLTYAFCGGADALAWRRRRRIGAAAGFAGAKARQRRAALLQERANSRPHCAGEPPSRIGKRPRTVPSIVRVTLG